MNRGAFMLYGSFRPLGSRELAGPCSSAVVVRSKRAFSAERIHRPTQCLTAGTGGLLRREADRLQQRIDCLARNRDALLGYPASIGARGGKH